MKTISVRMVRLLGSGALSSALKHTGYLSATADALGERLGERMAALAHASGTDRLEATSARELSVAAADDILEGHGIASRTRAAILAMFRRGLKTFNDTAEDSRPSKVRRLRMAARQRRRERSTR